MMSQTGERSMEEVWTTDIEEGASEREWDD